MHEQAGFEGDIPLGIQVRHFLLGETEEVDVRDFVTLGVHLADCDECKSLAMKEWLLEAKKSL